MERLIESHCDVVELSGVITKIKDNFDDVKIITKLNSETLAAINEPIENRRGVNSVDELVEELLKMIQQ